MYITPCVQVCKLVDDVCVGCGRTKVEITKWSQYSYYERMKVMKRLGYGKRTSTQDRMAKEATRRAIKDRRKYRE